MKTNIIVFGVLGILAVGLVLAVQNANAIAEAKAVKDQEALDAQVNPARTVTAGELSEAVRRNMQDASLSEIAVKFYDSNK